MSSPLAASRRYSPRAPPRYAERETWAFDWTDRPCLRRADANGRGNGSVQAGCLSYAEDVEAKHAAFRQSGPPIRKGDLETGEISGTARRCETEILRAWFAEALDYAGADGLTVLDVGCGQGIDLIEYARAGATAFGIDLTPRHVELAAEHLARAGLAADVRLGDAEFMPYPDNTFDRVSSNGVLHHTPDMPGALREIRRVLKPGGSARVIVYNRMSYHYWLFQVAWLGVLHGQIVSERGMSGVLSRGASSGRKLSRARPLVRVYSRRELRRLMVDAGFRDVRLSVGGFNPGDVPFTWNLNNPRTQAWLGRTGGWYVCAAGTRRDSSI